MCLTVLQLAATATPAGAHGGGAEIADYSAASRISYTVALAAAVLLGGVALLRPWTGQPTEAARRLIVTAGAAGVIATIVVAVDRREIGQYSSAAVLLALALAVLFRSQPWWALPVGAGLVGVLSVDAFQDSLAAGVLMLGHVLVAAVWSGAVLTAATAAPGTRLATVRRLGPIAIVAAGAAALTGVLSARDRGVELSGITVTSFGTVVLFKAGLLVLLALLGLSARVALSGRAGRRGPQIAGGLARAEFGVMVLTLVVGVVLTSLPSPGPPPRPGVPLVRSVVMDDAGTGVLVVPQRPGRNVVLLATDRFTELRIDGRTYLPTPSKISEGYWVGLDLPPGRTRMEIRQGREVIQQVLDVGTVPSPAGFDGPQEVECASAALGALLGGSQEPLQSCPFQALTDRDAGALRALVAHFADRKIRSVRLITDETGRGRTAARTITAAAQEAGITVKRDGKADALLALAGWETSHTALAELAKNEPPPTYGTYLAPWLLQASIVAATGASPLTPLWFDPNSRPVLAYLQALRSVAPDQSATTAGLAAFLAARAARGLPDTDPGPTVRLFAATSGFEVMPMNNGGEPMDHGARIVWLPKGSITPVSGPLRGR